MPNQFTTPVPVKERFWAKVKKTESCWLWTGSTARGYGHMQIEQKKMVYVHRYSYILVFGAIPDGLQIDHLCRVRLCVNPDHLEAVTQRENVLRGVGASALNARKTHCSHGHKFTVLNTYLTDAGRHCRICRRDSNRRYRRERSRHGGCVRPDKYTEEVPA